MAGSAATHTAAAAAPAAAAWMVWRLSMMGEFYPERMAPTLVWFRNDLRLADNPALAAAAARGAVVPVYVWAPDEEGSWPPGAASRWWLHGSLEALDSALHRHRSRLVI